jgi:hypothetical protein
VFIRGHGILTVAKGGAASAIEAAAAPGIQLTMSARFAVWLEVPLLPVIVSGYVPGAAG